MFDHQQFRELIIRPVLNALEDKDAKDSEEILIATMAYESKGGTYLKQEHGPALGPYQMEPKTYIGTMIHIYENKFLRDNMLKLFGIKLMPQFKIDNINSDLSIMHSSILEEMANVMIWDLKYATAMARMFYMQHQEPLPPADDIEKIWEYYKKYWNTELGKARKEHFIEDYNIFTKKATS